MTALLDEALAATAAGLSVLPCRADGTKRPDGPWKTAQHAAAGPDAVAAWYGPGAPTRGLGVVCGAVSGHLELLELDHGGTELWQAFVARCRDAGLGELLDRVVEGYSERTPGGGLHLLYRCPDGVEGNQKLARRTVDGEVQVLFETRGEGGFVVVAPTNGACHPTGRPWVRAHGGWDTIATITGAERQALLEVARSFDELDDTEPAPSGVPLKVPPPSSGDSWMDATVEAFNAATTWAEILGPHGWTDMGVHQGVGWWCRPGKDPRDGHSATTNANGTDRLIIWSTSVAVPGLEVASGASAPSYDRFSVWAAYHHGGDRQVAAVEARKAGHGPPWEERTDVDLRALIAGDAAPAVPIEQQTDLHLPDTFWDARPLLAAIRDAARSRLVSPDAVLGAVLTRVAASVPHTVELPGIVGGPVGLTFYAGLVGPPEAGKTAAAAVAAELFPAPPNVLDRLPIGTGEGMVEILFEMIEEEDEKGKKVKVKRQTRHAAIFHIDEGAVLADLGGRSGATLMPTLRTAYTHGTLGNANASIERRRILEGHLYVYGVTIGIQPELAGPLLGDTAAGTPQRFVWLMATDPAAGDGPGEWPTDNLWVAPTVPDLEPTATRRRGWLRHRLDVCDEIRLEVKAHRIAVMRGDAHVEAADAHRILVRLKVAALLAVLDRRFGVDEEDWALAGVMMDTSRRIRLAVEGALRNVEAVREATRIGRLTREGEAVEATRLGVPAKAARCAARLATWVHDQAAGDDFDGATQRELGRRLDGTERKHYLAAAVAHAVEQHWLVETSEGRYVPGESKPA